MDVDSVVCAVIFLRRDWFDSSEVQEMVKSDTAEKALPPSDAATERKNRNLLKGVCVCVCVCVWCMYIFIYIYVCVCM
jgi:hypothetical protein